MKAGLFLFLDMNRRAHFLFCLLLAVNVSCSQKRDDKKLVAEQFIRAVLNEAYSMDELVGRMSPRNDSVAFGYLAYWRDQLKRDSISFSDLQVLRSSEAENKDLRIPHVPNLFIAINGKKIYLPMTVDDGNAIQLKMLVSKGGRYFLLNFPE